MVVVAPPLKDLTELAVTEGKGNGIKTSKRRAAELMLDQLRQLLPMASDANKGQGVGPTNSTLYGDPHSAPQSLLGPFEDHQYNGFPSPLDLQSLADSDNEEPPTYAPTPLKLSTSSPGYAPSSRHFHPSTHNHAPPLPWYSPSSHRRALVGQAAAVRHCREPGPGQASVDGGRERKPGWASGGRSWEQGGPQLHPSSPTNALTLPEFNRFSLGYTPSPLQPNTVGGQITVGGDPKGPTRPSFHFANGPTGAILKLGDRPVKATGQSGLSSSSRLEAEVKDVRVKKGLRVDIAHDTPPTWGPQ